MNLFKNTSKIYSLSENKTHYSKEYSNIKRHITLPLLVATITIVVTTLTMSFRNKAEAAIPFGLNNDYKRILQQNDELASIVPMPIQSITTDSKEGDKRVIALLMFLQKYKSPAATLSVAKAYVENADKNGFGDRWHLMPSIAGIESGFCRLTPYKVNQPSYNCYGWGGPGNWYYFNSYEHGIEVISAGLAKGYGVKNLNPDVMMAKYCPPCAASGGAWARHVKGYMGELEAIYKSL